MFAKDIPVSTESKGSDSLQRKQALRGWLRLWVQTRRPQIYFMPGDCLTVEHRSDGLLFVIASQSELQTQHVAHALAADVGDARSMLRSLFPATPPGSSSQHQKLP